jgi:hypothetical protein
MCHASPLVGLYQQLRQVGGHHQVLRDQPRLQAAHTTQLLIVGMGKL